MSSAVANLSQAHFLTSHGLTPQFSSLVLRNHTLISRFSVSLMSVMTFVQIQTYLKLATTLQNLFITFKTHTRFRLVETL